MGHICQSCAMPLTEKDHYGTEADGSKSEKYCVYCYKEGQFTAPELDMNEMIQVSAKGWADQDSTITFEDAKKQMAQVIPHLERWRY